jgi:hypothetical protein
VWQAMDARCPLRPIRLPDRRTIPTNFANSSVGELPMITRMFLFVAAAIAGVLVMQSSAQALTMSECSAKYKDAKTAGTLNGASWNDFRKSQCDLAPSQRAKRAAPDSTVVAANATFPSAVDPKYSNEKPGRARRKTCLDQYKANKATNANGGLKWLQRGGGYYSQCAKKLKGAA